MPRFNPILEQLMTYPAVAVDQRKAKLLAEGRTVYDFGKGDPEESPPKEVGEALKNAVAARMPYPRVKGSDAVRQSIADYMERRFGVSLDPNTQIIPTSGSKEAVFHMPLLVIDRDAPDRGVVFPDPGYPAYQRGVLFAGGEAIAMHLTGDHILRPWTLAKDIVERTRMIWLNSPHNPSGAVMSLDDLQRSADFCREHDILLVSDETYADVYHSEPPHSLLECGTEGVLVLHSLSKRSGMTGYRSGFVAGDTALMSRLATFRTNPGLVPSDFVNAAAVAAWSDDQHAVERRAITRQKKQLFLDFFDSLAITVIGREASLYLWVEVPDGDDAAYAERLLHVGIVVSPGRIFGVDGAGVGYIRLAMVPKLDVCRDAIKVWQEMEDAWKR
jgi:LL-diaminopimelate aminotransferase